MIRAVLKSFNASIGLDPDPPYTDQRLVVEPTFDVTNETTTHSAGGQYVNLPISTSNEDMDAAIRALIVATVYDNWGWTLDPADIYFPTVN
jgi:hypothetical protein